MVSGKSALSTLNKYLQDKHQISISPMGIIDAIYQNEIPDEMKSLVDILAKFVSRSVADHGAQD
jgi:hypothetical protein